MIMEGLFLLLFILFNMRMPGGNDLESNQLSFKLTKFKVKSAVINELHLFRLCEKL